MGKIKSARRVGFIGVFLIVLLACNVNATIIIWVYYDGAAFVASDRLSSGLASDSLLKTALNDVPIKKVFQFTENSAVSISGWYGVRDLWLPAALETNCSKVHSSNDSLQSKINSVVSGFQSNFVELRSNIEANITNTVILTNLVTDVTFTGYDSATASFFCTMYEFGGTNLPKPKILWRAHHGDSFQMAWSGQEKFLRALLNPQEGDLLVPYRSEVLKNDCIQMAQGLPLSDARIRDWLLEILNLDENQAIRLGLDARPIKGPYRIIKETPSSVSVLSQ